MNLFVTAPKGMTDLLAAEAESFGGKVLSKTMGGVSVEGTQELAYRLCLHSRFANRVLLVLKKIRADDQKRLYGDVKAIRWFDHLDVRGTLAVDFQGMNEAFNHTHFGALKVKDAICDQFRERTGERPSVNPKNPSIRVNVRLEENDAIVCLDLSGESLHKRAYRKNLGDAPLKENLAAAILAYAEWPEIAAKGGAFLDPMCGTGTLPIEAAMMATKTAPGLERKYFGFTGWLQHDAKLWKRLVEEALDLQIRDPKKIPKILGFDQNPRAIHASLENAREADLDQFIHFEKRELKATERPADYETGLFCVNPPYGERLGEEEELIPLYREIGDVMKKQFKGWQGAVFTTHSTLAKNVGLSADRRIVLYNGALECRLLKFKLF